MREQFKISVNKERTGFTVIDKKILENLKEASLSNSSIDEIINCPADYLLNRVLKNLNIETEFAEPAVKGNLFHSVMEKIYSLPPVDRNAESIKMAVKEALKQAGTSIQKDKLYSTWLKQAVLLFWETKYRLDQEVLEINGEQAIEVFVKGKLAGVDRETLGWIDLVLQNEEETVTLSDWKTGKEVKEFDIAQVQSSANPFSYYRQQVIYSLLLEEMGYKVDTAELVYPIAEEIVTVDVSDPLLINATLEDIQRANSILDKCIKENFFPFEFHDNCKACHFLARKKVKTWQYLRVNKKQLKEIIEVK